MADAGVWRTVSGRRVFIPEGKSLSDAMKASGKFKDKSDVRKVKYEDLEKEVIQNRTQMRKASNAEKRELIARNHELMKEMDRRHNEKK